MPKLPDANRDGGVKLTARGVFFVAFIPVFFQQIVWPALIHGTVFGLPSYLFVLFGFPGLLAVGFWLLWERPRELRAGKYACPDCGYPIIGTGRCSECGWEVPRLPGEKKRW